MRIISKNKLRNNFWWCLVITIGLLTSATAMVRPTTSPTITITNNSALEIRHIYLSAVDSDNWGSDQLNDATTLAAGGSFAINDVSCAQGSIKVIAEDQNGCFFYYNADCTANSTWTIASNATPDCGQ
jgi:hypothetical protein